MTKKSIDQKSVSERIADAGTAAADTAKRVGKAIVSGVEQGAEYLGEKTGLDPYDGSDRGVNTIEEHMEVIASCGKKIGVVDRVEGKAIKLTRKDSPDRQHHYIPLSWVARVDSHVHLDKNSATTEADWKSSAVNCE